MASGIRKLIHGRRRDLGGFAVRRVLPAGGQQMVGPFIFLDHLGPATFAPGTGIDVRPHPHIGLATVTYLFAGGLLHRDSLGFVQEIEPGAVNWMTAGRGIVHSERTGDALRASGHSIHGLQCWVALPREAEECEPAFHHHAAATLPEFAQDDARVRVVVGTAYGRESPVAVHVPTLYAAIELPAGGSLRLPDDHPERGVYVIEGRLTVEDTAVEAGMLVLLEPDKEIRVGATGPVRAMLVGGAPADGPRHIWWNFVSSSAERIEQAKRDWSEHRFDDVPGETERIPLPEG